MNGHYVYFMRPIGEAGPYKIGFSARPEHRLKEYMAWSPVPLEIVARFFVEGGRCPGATSRARNIERRLHERYFAFHSHHEWFRANPLIEADIAAVIAGTFDIDALPPVTMATWRLPSFESEAAA